MRKKSIVIMATPVAKETTFLQEMFRSSVGRLQVQTKI